MENVGELKKLEEIFQDNGFAEKLKICQTHRDTLLQTLSKIV